MSFRPQESWSGRLAGAAWRSFTPRRMVTGMGIFDPDPQARADVEDWMSGRGTWVLVGLAAALLVVGVLVFAGVF